MAKMSRRQSEKSNTLPFGGKSMAFSIRSTVPGVSRGAQSLPLGIPRPDRRPASAAPFEHLDGRAALSADAVVGETDQAAVDPGVGRGEAPGSGGELGQVEADRPVAENIIIAEHAVGGGKHVLGTDGVPLQRAPSSRLT